MDPDAQPEDKLSLDSHIKLLETPFSEVCRILGLESEEPKKALEVDDSVFMFDAEQDYLFTGAVILDNSYGFFGIKIGANWLETAENLESQGFVQAEDTDRFTKPGEDFGACVCMYPDSDSTDSLVQHYSFGVRYGCDS